ncbi:MAG TPA: MauE/DoxX family redox-associated membrane protein [Gaiellaceae bacterium]|nr:MauE/DoxX family redox-associated membrane protein [Gaiellaceae bacterium]
MDTAFSLAVAAVLLGAALAKIRARREFIRGLEAYGLPERVRPAFWALLVTVEGTLGALLALGAFAGPAVYGAIALGTVFVAALARARLSGARRLPCGCFGGRRERSTSFLLARAGLFTALAGAAAAAQAGKVPTPSAEAAVLASLAFLALALVGLGVLVLALFRQVGVLSARLAPQGALELAEEGPELGRPAPELDDLARTGSALVAFFSPTCPLCRDLAPAVGALRRDGIQVRVVDEAADQEAFDRWNVPGSPFAVHVLDGAVMAKGLVNTLEQLDGLVSLGHARRRAAA